MVDLVETTEDERKGRYFSRRRRATKPLSERLMKPAPELPHDAPPEREHADDEDGALRNGHPRAELREVVLHSKHRECTHNRAEHRAEAAHEGHQYDFARHGPVNRIQRSELEDECVG